MRRTMTVLAMCSALATAPALGQSQSEKDDGNSSSQWMGRILGAGVGALLGSQVGGGKGKLAAVAVGALAGAWIGGEVAKKLTTSDREGIAQTTNTALETGESQTWTNPDTGVKTRVSVRDTTVERAPVESQGLKSRPWQSPPLDFVNAYYVAERTSNVRGGPGTDYAIMGTVERGERVAVVGKVRDEDWYMISDDGLGSGFVHASLLSAAREQPADANALRAESARAGGTHVATERTCSVITQEITMPDGATESRDMRACQQPDGSWVSV